MTEIEKFKYNYMLMASGDYDLVERYLRLGDYIITLDYTNIKVQLKDETYTRCVNYDSGLYVYHLYSIMDSMKLLANRLADRNINDIKTEVKADANRKTD